MEPQGAWAGAPLPYPELNRPRRLPLLVSLGCVAIILGGLVAVGLAAFDPLAGYDESDNGPGPRGAGTFWLTADQWDGNAIGVRFSGELEGRTNIANLGFVLRNPDGYALYEGPANGEQETLGNTYTVKYNDRGGNGLVSSGDWVVIHADPSNAQARSGVFRVTGTASHGEQLSLGAIRLP